MIEIVTHAYALKLPQYATLLRYQLASIAKWIPKTLVKVTVCCTQSDTLTNGVIQEFGSKFFWLVKSYNFISEGSLFRRAIARNEIIDSLDERTKVVWYADCDHVFGLGCIDSAYDHAVAHNHMVYPRRIQISKDHETGDRQIQEGMGPQLPEINTKDFVAKKYDRPIGGVFIINVEFLREHGYLRDTKWQNPRTDGKPFGDFRDDVAFRKYVKEHGRIQSALIPGLYRIRHSAKTY